MKKTMLSVCFMVTASMAGNVQASDGTIHFTGNITDQTCTVDGASQALEVPMGNIGASALAGGAGTVASPTRFTLVLTGCPDTVTSATIKFDGDTENTVAGSGILKLDSDSTATGVGIVISDNAGTPIAMHTDSPDYTLTTGDNDLLFTARYIATGDTVTTGSANATSQFTINYK
ncbi:fimbrial protein [Escherichia coli]|nr:fimbrial protein [Escherichia coli]MBS9237907.1 fimbrial protein [Escherichia coli]HCN8311174.1 fimbrial protein [Escherichia coli]HCO7722235.1 fimbrial protein [Escherichia coli]